MNGRIKRVEKAPRLNFPFLGKIKCGKMIDKGGKQYPVSVDYFIPTGAYSSYFTAEYGEAPRTIQVVFLDDDPALVCDERLELRSKDGKLVSFGDRINFEVFSDSSGRYEKYSTIEHPELIEKLAKKWQTEWVSNLKMRVLIPKINGVLGYWEINTKGVNSSIPEITGIFDQIIEDHGHIKGIIFDLNVKMHTSNKPGSKSRYPVLSLVPNHSVKNLELIQKHFALGSGDSQNRIG